MLLRGRAFEISPGRKWEKLKELKAEGIKKRFFSPCARVLEQGQSLLFLNTIRVLRLFLPQEKLLRIWWAKGHSSFNRFCVPGSLPGHEISLIWSRKPSWTPASFRRCVTPLFLESWLPLRCAGCIAVFLWLPKCPIRPFF